MQEDINKVPVVALKSYEDFLEKISEIIEIYKDVGVLVFRGYQFSDEEHKEVARSLGDILGWNMFHGADPFNESGFYDGGHSDLDDDLKYTIPKDKHMVDWHIEQVYYVYPILAGLWNMYHFSAEKGEGNTLFVDSCRLYENLLEEDKEFLADAIMFWKKQGPQSSGPYYTKAVDIHPNLNKPTLRIETDEGCQIEPQLFSKSGKKATEEEKKKFKDIVKKIKLEIFSNEELLLTQEWEQNDLLLVDLYRMYHSVLGGFDRGERKFKGLGVRPRVYNHDLYTSEEGVWTS